MIDLSEERWMFDLWDHQGLDTNHRNELLGHYKTSGIENRSLQTVIPIIVLDDGQVDRQCLVSAADIYGNVPAIEWAVWPALSRVIAAGGYHRRAALIAYIEEVKATIRELQDMEDTEELREKQLAAAIALGKSLGPWLASVYNGSASHISLALCILY